MCRSCYLEFLQVAGSVEESAANPPAYTRSVQRELAAQQAEVPPLSCCPHERPQLQNQKGLVGPSTCLHCCEQARAP